MRTRAVVPVVLPVVRVGVDDSGALRVELDGEPYDARRALGQTPDRMLGRRDLRGLLRVITTDLGGPVRVEVTEADGTTYTDIEVPPTDTSEFCAEAPTPMPARGIGGSGFHPGEPVALAYVLLQQIADDQGQTSLPLPPSVLHGRSGSMLLVGLESHRTTLIEAPA